MERQLLERLSRVGYDGQGLGRDPLRVEFGRGPYPVAVSGGEASVCESVSPGPLDARKAVSAPQGAQGRGQEAIHASAPSELERSAGELSFYTGTLLRRYRQARAHPLEVK